MAILPITQYGDKILTRKAKPVEKVELETITLIKDMFETMKNAEGAGLAANQVGSDKSIFVIDISHAEGYEDTKPMVFINPKITFRSEEQEPFEEGCLSIPAVRAEVIRPRAVKITFMDAEDNIIEIEDDGLLARVIQHEYDHLQGVYFTDRVNDDIKKAVKKDLIDIKNRKLNVPYPITDKE